MRKQESSQPKQKKVLLQDYKPPFFSIEEIVLDFFLNLERTQVISKFYVRPYQENKFDQRDLVLNGRNLSLLKISLDERQLGEDEYILDSNSLTLPSFRGGTLTIETSISPAENTDLDGLYASDGGLYTQCEAEGFRKITFFIDRPDVLAKYTVNLHGLKNKFPILLANGNLIKESFNKSTGVVTKTWEDPFPKPCYLFALVAADLSLHEEKFQLPSGREVLLQFYTKKPDIKKIDHALDSLKSAILWDENRNNLKLDLERFMIVAVPDFNSGAMENKGLNLFNTKYVLADQDLSTDRDYESITAVIGHEYFHNWTGNRITCRDWFQLTLKEGLTVFREQEFVADFSGNNLSGNQARIAKAVKRIEDVQIIREKQFPEDSSPMAHPIRPNSYSEIRNFYTTTIYEKGAEVIRMLHTIFGEIGFQAGMQKYIANFDGSAATCEDFVNSMLEANDRQDLFHIFMRWYDSKGTPTIDVKEKWDPINKIFTVILEQKNKNGSIEIKPLLIPIKYKFLNSDQLSFSNNEQLILLQESRKTVNFRFPDSTTSQKPFLSLFRNFSSPVNVVRNLSTDDILFQLKKDDDPFNKWDAAQQLYILSLTEKNDSKLEIFTHHLTQALKEIINNNEITEGFKALVLTPPPDSSISEALINRNQLIDPDFIYNRKTNILKSIADSLKEELSSIYNSTSKSSAEDAYLIDPISIGKRKLKNLIQLWLSQVNFDSDWQKIIINKFFESKNMTDRISSLKSILLIGSEKRHEALSFFYDKYQNDPIALDKWISVQIESEEFFSYQPKNTLSTVKDFLNKDFFTRKNPNRIYAVLGSFFFKNLNGFHNINSDESYQLWTQEIILLDKHNSQLAARLSRSFDNWQNFEEKYKSRMKLSLEKVLDSAKSNDVIDVCSRLLKKN